ncbi:MAG TPA: hypothetical protein PK467_00895 [Candidatus Wallbacteria bacterium]|nr:hypothetical protein [Candidatus Wallbacteria bacterium]
MTFNPSITKPIAGMEMFTKSRAAGHSGQPFETNEMGWLVYPEGIYRAVKAIGRYGAHDKVRISLSIYCIISSTTSAREFVKNIFLTYFLI